MPLVPSPQTVLERVRRDVERNALRARNGIKLVAGIDRPGVGCTPKDVVWQRGRSQLWHYRNDDVRWSPPLLILKYTKPNQTNADAEVAYTLGE